jgi:cytochrome c-type biogenesis protein CcmH/NrfG
MRPSCTFVFAAVSLSLACAPQIAAQQETPIDQAVKLTNQGHVDRAIAVLRDHLKGNPKDVNARGVLGRILDFDGRPDEAVTNWENGLTGAAPDFDLLMAIGEVRHRQGSDGPNVSYRRGTVGANPSKNEAEDERYKRSRLEQAVTTYEKARKLRPGEPSAASALASVYTEQGKPDSAANVWKSLVKLEPRNAEYRMNLGLATKRVRQVDAGLV